jgi:Tol biopolymer transport system component
LFENSAEREFRGFDWGIGENELVLVVHTSKTREDSIASLDLESSSLTSLLPVHDLEPAALDMSSFSADAIALSRDRRWLAIQGHNSARHTGALYLWDLENRTSRKLLEADDTEPHPHQPAWTPDGRHLVVEMNEEESDLFVVDLTSDSGT